jgi:uncharacterized protein (TIGR00369 family)
VLTVEEIQMVFEQGLPASKEWGLLVESASPEGKARVRYCFRPDMIRPGGTLSGPTMMALADAAMFASILGRLGRLEMAVTTNLNINFLRRPAPADLIAESSILKLGKRLAVLEVSLFSATDDPESIEPVAHVTGTYSLPPTLVPR